MWCRSAQAWAEGTRRDLVRRILGPERNLSKPVKCSEAIPRDVLLGPVAHGNAKLVSWLLKLGANPNVAYPDYGQYVGKKTLLHEALNRIGYFGYPDAIALKLILHGANIGDSDLWSPVRIGNLRVAKELLETGVDPNKGPEISKPLGEAVTDHDIRMIKLLLKHGADPKRVCFYEGPTAIELAKSKGFEDVYKLFTNANCSRPRPT